MERDDRTDSVSSTSPEPPEGGAKKPEGIGSPRVLDAGTSQELVIINYADDALVSARERAVERGNRERETAAAETGNATTEPASAPEPEPAGDRSVVDPSLIIVRDAAFGWNADEVARPKTAPLPPPPRAPAPAIATPPARAAAPETAEPPPWARRPNAGSFPPLPPKAGPDAGAAWIEPFAPSPAVEARARTRIDARGADPGARRDEGPSTRAKPDEASKARPGRARTPRPAAPRASLVAMIAALVVFAGATALSILDVEPFHTWYYLFAWYPFLLVANHWTAVQSPAHSIFSARARRIAAVAAWSVPVWLAFEICNFRLENWYYIGVPDAWLPRRLGMVLAFATVLPGIFFLEEGLRARHVFGRMRTPPFQVTRSLERKILIAGIVVTALVAGLPTFFFPLVWGLPVLWIDPWLRRRGGPSLLGDLAAGKFDRWMRLLVAGLACGLFWESANFLAGGRWVYTIPGLASGKLFEMPIPGFLGFAPFAWACWTMARALVSLGLMPDWDPPAAPRPPAAARSAASTSSASIPAPGTASASSASTPAPSATAASSDAIAAPTDEPPADAPVAGPAHAPAAATASMSRAVRLSLMAWTLLAGIAAFEALDRLTVDSRTPRPEEVPGIPPGVAEYARRHGKDDVQGLLGLVQEGRLHIPGWSSERENALLAERCRLILTRGIGTDNARRLDAAGVRTLAELADQEPHALTRNLYGVERGWWPRERRVAVWIEAARRETR